MNEKSQKRGINIGTRSFLTAIAVIFLIFCVVSVLVFIKKFSHNKFGRR